MKKSNVRIWNDKEADTMARMMLDINYRGFEIWVESDGLFFGVGTAKYQDIMMTGKRESVKNLKRLIDSILCKEYQELVPA